ncbi:MAG: helix-turn-helix domain-containing protein, partial [Bacteroidota bacterium]
MANQRITMAKVRQILRLHSQGKTKLQISDLTGVARNTVKKYLRVFHQEQLQSADVEAMNDYHLSQLFCADDNREPTERLRSLMALLPGIEKALKRRGMTRTKQWQEYFSRHPDGFRFTSFCHYLNRYLNQTRPVMHIEHKAGDKMFIDFAGEKMHYWSVETGEKIEVEVFAAILG